MRLFLVTLLLLISVSGYSPEVDTKIRVKRFNYYVKELRIQEIRKQDFNTKLLVEYVNLKYPNSSKVSLKQFILETGWFKSKIFKENNNICGMRLPKVRKTTAIGSKYNHAVYNSVWDSIDDYYYWYEYHKKYHNDDYYLFLKSVGYAESNSYIKLLKQIKVKWQKQ